MSYQVTWKSHWVRDEVFTDLTEGEAEELVREGVDRQYKVSIEEQKS